MRLGCGLYKLYLLLSKYLPCPMIVIDHAVISDDIKEQLFVCNLQSCKGACCVEGDLGAPLEKEELAVLDEEYEHIAPFLTLGGRAVIEEQGKYVLDYEDDYSTPTIDGRECAYALYDDNGILKCGIEQAWQAGKTTFRKPISCHLYPLRITQYEQYDALNYHNWHICSAACTLGQELGVPLYRFLKEALIRKYGKAWYNKLVHAIEADEGFTDEFIAPVVPEQ